MPDEVVVAPEAPPPVKEHWKTRQKRLAAEAAARGETAPAPTSEPEGFLSWDEFCNRVAVDLVTSQFGFTMLTNYAVGEASQVFFARMELAFKAMKDAHARGATKGL